MPLFTVKWEIDVDMPSAQEAADWAWDIMKEQENDATYLDVYEGEQYIQSYDMDKSEGV